MQKRPILELLLPKTRASILRTLFIKPKKGRSVRELARLTDSALRSTQDELETLLATGLLNATPWKNGCRRFYRPNADHPLFPHLLGLVHGDDRIHKIDVSNLRRVRARKWKRKARPKPSHRRAPARSTGRMYPIQY